MKKMNAAASSAALLLAFSALPAHAALTVYTDKAAFTAAAGSVTTETFTNATLGTSTANYSGTFNGFTLTSVSNGDYSGIANGSLGNTAPPAPFNGQNFYGWGERSNGNGNDGPTTTFHFDNATTAFGFDWFNTDFTDAYSVTVNSLTSSAAFNYGSAGFFGVIATGGETFTTATIQNRAYGGYVDTEGLDNVLVKSASVPEPTSIALLGIAAAGFAASRRKRNR